jgi:hypothetical protein
LLGCKPNHNRIITRVKTCILEPLG